MIKNVQLNWNKTSITPTNLNNKKKTTSPDTPSILLKQLILHNRLVSHRAFRILTIRSNHKHLNNPYVLMKWSHFLFTNLLQVLLKKCYTGLRLKSIALKKSH